MSDLRLDHIECADALTYLRSLPDESVNCCITSPPYFGLRSYLENGHEDKAREIGLEDTPAAYVAALVGMRTPSAVRWQLDRLRAAGLVDWRDGASRTLRLTGKAAQS